MTDTAKWNERYQSGDIPWDTGRPSPELQRVLQGHNIHPCRGLDLGCGPARTASGWSSKVLT